MNNTKRVLSVLLAALMLASVVAVVAIADGSQHNIVINYVFQDSTVAATPWTASIGDGQPFAKTVTSPTIVGYTPDRETVTINELALNKDITVTVTYKPALVNYTVKHYQQNVVGDSDKDYTLVLTEPKQGYTESAVGANLAKPYDGFTALLYDADTKIAADGSTVVEIKYDRNYYLMKFDLDGGYGVEPVYARYGAAIGDVGTPSKAGYTFKGWSETEGGTTAITLPTTMPAENKPYYAIWEADDTAKVTIVFWGENADDEGYSYLADSTKTIDLRPGSEFTYSEEGILTCTKEVHSHSNECFGCGYAEEHTHSKNCYDGVGNDATSGSAGKPDSPSEGQVYKGNFFTYIYINGTWYYYTGSTASGNIAPTTCGKTAHKHSDSCYNCGKQVHSHSSACYSKPNLDSNLWKFVKSDTVTVKADGSSVVNVYYDRTEFTLTFKDGSTTVKTLTKKWGENISDNWPVVGSNGKTYNNGERWQPSGSKIYTEVLVYLSVMPAESFTLRVDEANYHNYYMHYMVEALPNAENTESYNGTTYVERFNVTANYNYVTKAEDFFDLEGFTQKESNPEFSNGQINTSGGDVYFYYSRNSYTLTFNDQYSDVKKESVKYEAPLSTYSNYVPEVPSAYEAGSVLFAGWYQNPQCTGEEYKLDEHTMPANDVILYAKWVPVVHTVTTRLTADAEDEIGKIENVPHGSTVDKDAKAIAIPKNGQYTFVGWFYVDEDGTEKAFDPKNMQVNRDLDLYAKWRSDVLVPYTISYQLEDGTKVADDTTDTALGGTTKTFDAKVGDELDKNYQEGYFPNVSSHSITMSIEANAKNEFVFIYTKAEAMPYTVRYLEKDTEAVLHDAKVVSDNRKSVVDEYYVSIEGYMPDAPQKRLIISTEGENVLTFWYTEDNEHAPVTIIHWTQNIVGDDYAEHSRSSYTGDINATITADVLTIEGFAYAQATATYGDGTTQTTVTEIDEKTKVSATLTASGLIINLYYDRIEYPYEFRFVSALDGSTIAPSVTGNARFGAQVTQNAKSIDGYILALNAPENAAITIAVEEGTTAEKNVYTFKYDPYYNVVHVTDGTAGEPVLYRITNNLKQNLTGTVTSGYLYGGTFSDKECETVYQFYTGESGLSFTPDKGATYYIWEPNENYLQPKAYSIWRNSDPNAGGKTNIIEVYLASTVDREMYQEVGFTLNGNNYLSNLGSSDTATVYSKVRTAYTDGTVKEDLYADNSNGTLALQKGGLADSVTLNRLVSMVKVSNHTQYSSEGNAMVYQPYWITLDGVTVTGIKVRTCYYQGAGYNELKVVSDAKSGSTCSYGSGVQQTAVLADVTAELRAIADGEDAPAVEETPVIEETPTEPEVYEVPEMTYEGEAQYLRVQYTANTMLNTATLISAVDMSEFSEAGFIINGKKYVCTAFSTMVEGYDANYLFGSTVEGATLMSCNVALDGFTNGETLHITPYWVNNDGVAVYGETRTVVYYSWCGFEG